MKKTLALTIALGIGITYSAAPAHTYAKESLKSKLDTVQNEKSSQLSQKEQVAAQEQQLQKEVNQIGQQVMDMTGKISQKQVEYNSTKDNIDKLQGQIEKTQARMKKREAYFRARAKSYYLNGDTSFLDVMLGSKSFGDMIERAFAMKEISDNDQKVIDQQKKDKATLEDNEAKVEQDLKATEQQMSDLQAMLSKIQDMQSQKKKAADILSKKATSIDSRLADLNKAEKVLSQEQSNAAAKAKKMQAAADLSQASTGNEKIQTMSNDQTSASTKDAAPAKDSSQTATAPSKPKQKASDNSSSGSSSNHSTSAHKSTSKDNSSNGSSSHHSSSAHESTSQDNSTLLPSSVSTGGVSGIIHAGDKYLNGHSTYVYGGGRTSSDVANGRFDCSGFVYWAFRSNGIMLGGHAYGSTQTLHNVGTRINSKSDLRPGDLVFFNTDGSDSHVGIYIGGGEWIGSQNSYGVQTVSINDRYYWGDKFSHGQRVLGN